MFDNNSRLILKQLLNKGYKAMFVGGGVRDCIIGRDFYDIDIVTDALPDTIYSIFSNYPFKAIKTGFKYGTVTVVFNGIEYQITTLRKDVVCFGRDAIVEFSDSFEEDSNRRDFTFNALYLDIFNKVYDYHNGRKDLINRNVVFIGNIEDRIEEDYLRILRYFRFWSIFDGKTINKKYKEVISELSCKIQLLSKERIKSEFLKILSSENVIATLKFMSETKVLDNILEYDLSEINEGFFKAISSVGKLSIINRSSNIKEILCLSNKEYNLLKFFQRNFSNSRI